MLILVSLGGSTTTLILASLDEPTVEMYSARSITRNVTRYVELDVLVVIYTNTAGGKVDPDEIAKLKEEVTESEQFFWRNSHLKLDLNISYLIIDRYVPIEEFWEISNGSYWLPPWTVEKDLRNYGIGDNQYDGVVVFYGWGDNEYRAAFGGATYGVDIGFLGKTGYSAIPLAWDPDIYDAYFVHEFLHQIDSMFEASGLPEFPNPDMPHKLKGDFGRDADFRAYILRSWPVENWFKLVSPWGDIIEVEDNDQDGVPDNAPGLTITEAILGTSTSSRDTDNDGLSDLEEVMAGIYSGSNPLNIDTDGDGITDGLDPYPIYDVNPWVPKNTIKIDGELESEWHSLTDRLTYINTPFNASIKVSWDDNYLYLGMRISNFALIVIYIDANNDGWFHGKDNYKIIVDPSHDDPAYIIMWASIWDCTNETSKPACIEQIIAKEDIKRAAKKLEPGYVVELAIPKNAETGLMPKENTKIGLQFEFYYIGYGRFWGTAFEHETFVDIILGESIPFVWIYKSLASRERGDAGSIQTIGFHAVYDNGSPVTDGVVYINGTAYLVDKAGWAAPNYSFPKHEERYLYHH